MKGFVIHDSSGKVSSFGIARESKMVRPGMHPTEHASVATLEVDSKQVEELQRRRGSISSKLWIEQRDKRKVALRIGD